MDATTRSRTPAANAPAKQKPIETMKLGEIADEIHERLQQLDNDPTKNKDGVFHSPKAYRWLKFMLVRYVDGVIGHRLTKEQARHYLDWLRKGNCGTHQMAGIDA